VKRPARGRGKGDRPRERTRSADPANVIYGVHPVCELLEHRPREVERLWIAREPGGGAPGRVLRHARRAGVPVTRLPAEVLRRRLGPRARHQGVAAVVAAMPYSDHARVIEAATAHAQGLLVLADRVTDPANLGAIVRTAAGAGAHGVLLGGGGTVGLTPAVIKVAAGTVERIPIAREPWPARRLRDLRDRGFRAVGLDPRSALAWDAADLGGRLVVVAGGEERGARPSVLEACDIRVAIPLARGVESLNVAISLGVLLFEVARRRRLVGPGS